MRRPYSRGVWVGSGVAVDSAVAVAPTVAVALASGVGSTLAAAAGVYATLVTEIVP